MRSVRLRSGYGIEVCVNSVVGEVYYISLPEIGGVEKRKNCTKKETEPKKGTKPSVERYPVFFLDIMDVFLGFQKNCFQKFEFLRFINSHGKSKLLSKV